MPDTLKHHPDTVQTPPDTIQTPTEIGTLTPYIALVEKATSQYHGLIQIFANIFGIERFLDTLRHRPDTRRHHTDTPRQKHFYTIEGTGRIGNIKVS